MWISIFAATLGSFLIGYTISVMAGAIVLLSEQLKLTLMQVSFITSSILIGGMFGSTFSHRLERRLGRRRSLVAGGLLCGVGVLLSLSSSVTYLLIGRLVTGIAIGFFAVLVPLYLAELAPQEKRGRIVGLHQLAITLGALCAFLAGYYCSCSEWMLSLALPPALLLCVALLFAKDVEKGTEEKSPSLWHVDFRKVIVIGFLISVFQQITGINGILLYAPTLFKLSGFAQYEEAMLASLGLSLVNVLSTLAAGRLMDRLGRKPLLLIGLCGMIVALSALAMAFWLETSYLSLFSMVTLFLFIAAFSISLGPITWVLLSELFPPVIRSSAMSMATLLNWIAGFLVASSFPFFNS